MQLRALFNNIPQQLSANEDRTTNKFKFNAPDLGSAKSFSRLQTPIEWLERAGLIYKVKINNRAEHPLSSFSKDNYFKLYPFDVGITGAQLGLPIEKIISQDYGMGKGFFAENLVLQGLIKDDFHVPYSWTEGSAEIEFLIIKGGEIIPVEVKSGLSRKAKSLASYIKRYAPKLALKFHAGRFGYDESQKILTLPLYAAWDIDKI